MEWISDLPRISRHVLYRFLRSNFETLQPDCLLVPEHSSIFYIPYIAGHYCKQELCSNA